MRYCQKLTTPPYLGRRSREETGKDEKFWQGAIFHTASTIVDAISSKSPGLKGRWRQS